MAITISYLSEKNSSSNTYQLLLCDSLCLCPSGAKLFDFNLALGKDAAGGLSTLAPDHPDADAVCLIQTFYALTIRLAALRGTDVERPRHLNKVTRTR